MNSKNNFVKKIGIYFIGMLSTKMLSVILVPIYAYFVLTEDLGNYDYIISIANIVVPIVYIVIWEAVLKYCIGESDTQKLKDKIYTVVIFYITISVLVAFICGSLYILTKNKYFLVTVGFIITYGGASIWQFAGRAMGENKCYVISGILGSITVILIDILCILFYKLDFTMLSIANIISQFIIMVVLEIKIHLLKDLKKGSFNREFFFRMARFSIPLVINNVSLWAYTGSSKIIIKNFIGASDNGLYSFASKFSIVISLFSTVISMAVIEESYSFDSLIDYRRKMSKLISEISKGYFVLIMWVLPVINILYNIAFLNTPYYSSSNFIPYLLLGALFTALSNNFGSAFQVTEKTKYISITTIVGAAIALLLSLILVNIIGVYGVLISGVIGPLVMMLLRAIYAKKATGLSIKWRENIILCIVIMIESLLLMFNRIVIVEIIIFIITTSIVLVIYRNYLKEIKKYILKTKHR